MGMSTHVVGFIPRDEKWEKYEAIYRSCEEAGVEPPDEVMEFFEWESPLGKPGQVVDISQAVEDFAGEAEYGFTVNLSELPKNVTAVRFFNSW